MYRCCIFGLLIVWFVWCFRCFNGELSWSMGPRPIKKDWRLISIELLSRTEKGVVSCCLCKILFEAQTTHRGLPFGVGSHNALRICSRRWQQHIKPTCASESYMETVWAGQVVTDFRACWDQASLRGRTAKDTSWWWYNGGTPDVSHHEDQGCGSPMPWKRGVSNRFHLLLLLLVLLGTAKFVLPLPSAREKFIGTPWSCPANSKLRVPR